MKSLLFLGFAAACTKQPANASAQGASAAATQQASAQANDWKSLMDASAWRGYKVDTVPSRWSFANGQISKERPTQDIITRDEFGNFELEFEWKISEAGNAGVLYRGTEEYDHIYWSAPEYQLLDNVKGADNKTPLTRAAAVYAIYPAPDGHDKPAGEWNQGKIVANGNHVEHWLNGFLMEQYDFGSPDWEARVKASKFKDWPNYGRARKGHISLQGDHNGTLAFRNVRIRELP